MSTVTPTQPLVSPPTTFPLTLRRITVDEYERIIASGSLNEPKNVELIDGYMVTKVASAEHGFSITGRELVSLLFSSRREWKSNVWFDGKIRTGVTLLELLATFAIIVALLLPAMRATPGRHGWLKPRFRPSNGGSCGISNAARCARSNKRSPCNSDRARRPRCSQWKSLARPIEALGSRWMTCSTGSKWQWTTRSAVRGPRSGGPRPPAGSSALVVSAPHSRSAAAVRRRRPSSAQAATSYSTSSGHRFPSYRAKSRGSTREAVIHAIHKSLQACS